MMRRASGGVVYVTACAFAVVANSGAYGAQKESYSPESDWNYPTMVYWGDTHLHTILSVDAYNLGNRLTRDDAYSFAKGEVVRASNGMMARLDRALDFLVITDHAEDLGVMRGLDAQDPLLLETEASREMAEKSKKIDAIRDSKIANEERMKLAIEAFKKGGVANSQFRKSVWEEIAADADKQNKPGVFTAFIGYEWTSFGRTKEVGNLHRNVIFRDGADKATQVVPFSSYDSNDPERLWAYLDAYMKKTGGEVLAIPHNGNTSNGEMFAVVDFEGHALSKAYAQTRSRLEPLYEVTQIKGDSEAHPILSPTDEFADYETWNSWGGRSLPKGRAFDGKEKELKTHEYARSALKLGLEQQVKIDANPFKFGLIGSTDAHTSLAAVEEDNNWGKAPSSEPGPHRLTRPFAGEGDEMPGTGAGIPPGWQMSSSGYAAVWATANTREALFDAMKRRETYATTGPRMIVRFFGGWAYQKDDAYKSDLARIGYAKGVPMGGDLAKASRGKVPVFLIRAVKDPDGANLDRVQVVKGWVDKSGKAQEKIFNVALSDGRKEDANGKAPPVGSTVDVAKATYTNTIGAPELAVVWQDPDFDRSRPAFYYLRVLEIPTPRWTAYDAKYFHLKNLPAEIPMVTQERAYTSPIWYTP